MSTFMITKISAKNFKSLADFEISDLPQFVCLIGVNGSGKTTLLQLLGFIRAMMSGNVHDWLADHDMLISDILTIGNERRVAVELYVEALIDGKMASWEAKFNTRELRCTYEKIVEKGNTYTFSSGKLYRDNEKSAPMDFDFEKTKYEGSIFSFFVTELSAHLQFLQLYGVLDPRAIAKSTRFTQNRLVPEVKENGENLCGFIASLPLEKQQNIFNQLRDFYPPLKNFKVKKQRFGWKSILLSELEKTVFSASNLSYGTLRLFLMISQQYSQSNSIKSNTILFDEVENGLNQEMFEKLVKLLLNYGNPTKQVFVTTHSGLLLNYLPDEVAKESVYFFYKDSNNYTKAKRFFDIDMMKDKLNVLGPGEAMGDTDLIQLSESLKSL